MVIPKERHANLLPPSLKRVFKNLLNPRNLKLRFCDRKKNLIYFCTFRTLRIFWDKNIIVHCLSGRGEGSAFCSL